MNSYTRIHVVDKRNKYNFQRPKHSKDVQHKSLFLNLK